MIQNNNNTEKKSKMLSAFYIALSIIAVIVMIIAAMITYGYDAHEIKTTFKKVFMVEDILNNTIPNVCSYEDLQEYCDKEPLSCLKAYAANKIFVKNPGNENQSCIELTTEKMNNRVYKDERLSNNMGIAVDTSQAPNDDVIEDILNDTIPNVCDYEDYDDLQEDCDKEPLSCLKEYEINKIFVKNPGYENQLFIELTTGKTNDHVYTVVIDLANNNAVINASGKIDDKRCRDIEEDDDNGDDNLFLNQGEDPKDSDYVDTKPRE